MLHILQQQFPFTNQPWNELSALMTCSYTLMPLRNTLSSRNCSIEINIDFEHHILDKDKERKEVAAWFQLPHYGRVVVLEYLSSEKTQGQECPAASQSVNLWLKIRSRA
jgi:hypothetical protein